MKYHHHYPVEIQKVKDWYKFIPRCKSRMEELYNTSQAKNMQELRCVAITIITGPRKGTEENQCLRRMADADEESSAGHGRVRKGQVLPPKHHQTGRSGKDACQQGCSRSIDLGGKDQDHDLFGDLYHCQ